jgi:diguanylate cyclase (GGDEF)-like protein
MESRSTESPAGGRVHHSAAAAVHALVFAIAAAAFGLGLVAHPTALLKPEYLLWVALVATAELLPVPVWREARLDLSFPLSVAAAILFPPVVAGSIAFVGACDIREFRGQIPVLRALFNRSQIGLSTALVSVVFHAFATADSSLSRLLPAAVLAALAGYLLNVLLVTVAMSLDYGLAPREVVRRLRVGSPAEFLLSYLGFGLLGAVIAHIYTQVGAWSLPLIIGPVLLARQAFFRSRELEVAETKYRSLVEQIPAVTYVRGAVPGSGPAYVSPQVGELLGESGPWERDPAAWMGRVHPQDRDRVGAARAASEERGSSFGLEYRLVRLDGSVVWVRDEARLVEGGEYWQGVLIDITAGKAAEAEISFLAHHDRLTGLGNRAMAEEAIGPAVARARLTGGSVAVLSLDLDDFKLVNDGLGRAAGDQLLREVAGRLRDVIRPGDVLVRQGGDEFLLVLGAVEARQDLVASLGPRMAERVHDTLSPPFRVAGTEVYLTASIGVSVFPLDAAEAGDLLVHADAAMYRAKAEGPGVALSFGGPSDRAGDLSFATRLRRATREEAWSVACQPIVDLVDGTVVGVESLVRWNDPELGPVSPSRFVPVAEDLGLIGRVDDWVLGEMCRHAAEWRRQGVELDVHVNVSFRRVWEADLVRRILSTVEGSGLDPASIVIEITESAAMADLDRTRRVLDGLHATGVRVALDDFGTAHSSLSRLRDLDIDILKIDRPFLRDVPHNTQAAGMLAAIVQLARSLGLVALAEGIETPGQLDVLVRQGCRRGQGFYLSPPVPPEAIPLLVHRGPMVAAAHLAPALAV